MYVCMYVCMSTKQPGNPKSSASMVGGACTLSHLYGSTITKCVRPPAEYHWVSSFFRERKSTPIECCVFVRSFVRLLGCVLGWLVVDVLTSPLAPFGFGSCAAVRAPFHKRSSRAQPSVSRECARCRQGAVDGADIFFGLSFSCAELPCVRRPALRPNIQQHPPPDQQTTSTQQCCLSNAC